MDQVQSTSTESAVQPGLDSGIDPGVETGATPVARALDESSPNQRYPAAEFARLKELLRSGSTTPLPARGNAATENDAENPPALELLVRIFGLSAFERELLLLCAGVEMDSELAALCAEAQCHPDRQFATFGLAMATFGTPHWSALSPYSPLRRYRLLVLEANRPFTTGPLRLEERVLHYIAGINLLDPRLDPLLASVDPPRWITESQRAAAESMARFWRFGEAGTPMVNLYGDDDDGQRDASAYAAELAGMSLLVLHADDLPSPGPELELIAQLWRREALLLPAALLLQCGAEKVSPSARRLAERLEGPLVITSHTPVPMSRSVFPLQLDKPTAVEQKLLWQRIFISQGGEVSEAGEQAAIALAEQFRLSARTIERIADRIGPEAAPSDAWTACRAVARPKLEELAQRVDCSAGWSQLVLPPAQVGMLQQIAAHVRYRLLVHEQWGFSGGSRRGLGVSVLFAGESGTGKTLAAEVLAHELALDLYRVDLSAVVSKYIGESEKNLRQIFDAAEQGGVALLFDEADALFGKRTEVKDSHDHYANIQVGYLLQRLETFEGLAILTTNFKSSLDRAFQRRLRFTVNFTFPESAQREEIWRRVFPPQTPTVDLDPKRLAQFHGTGGSIRNIALNATFLAAQRDRPVGMDLLLEAARMETHKMERPLSDSETRGWV